jgi:hypothetical protein
MNARDCKWLLLCFALACRFGGPKQDPTRWLDLGGDAAIDRGDDDPSAGPDRAGGGAGGQGGGGGAGPVSPLDAAIDVDDAGPATANDARAPGGPALDAGAEGGPTCAPPSPPAVCDPVNDTGCEPGSQCDVDLFQGGLAGVCVFSTPYDAGPCTMTPLSQSCPGEHTCVLGVCRQLCFCDADCAPGECCVEPLDTLGWTLCARCP